MPPSCMKAISMGSSIANTIGNLFKTKFKMAAMFPKINKLRELKLISVKNCYDH